MRLTHFVYSRSSSSILVASLLLLLFLINTTSGFIIQEASACQCIDPRPEIYKEADVIFVGTVKHIDRQVPLENARYFTFDVSKSWKGLDTKSITIHNDSSQCDSIPAKVGEEWLIFAYNKDFLKINVGCGGALWTGYPGSSNEETFVQDVKHLEELYTPVELRTGHTMSVNPFPLIVFAAVPIVLGIAAYVILVKRA